MSEYRLDIGEITMKTEGGGIVHAEDEAFATEKVVYYARVDNFTDQFLGPFEVDFLIDGQKLGWGGMSHQGIAVGQSEWFQGFTDRLSVGNHTLHIKIDTGGATVDTGDSTALFEGGEQTVHLRVLEPASHRAMGEGEEYGKTGWFQRQVYLWIEDFRGQGLPRGDAYVTFSGPGGEASERGQVVNGDLTLDSVWVPNEGNIRLVVATQQLGGKQLTGGTNFALKGDSVRMAFTQEKRIENKSASEAKQLAASLAVKGSYGVDFKIFKAGVEVTATASASETWTEGVSYEVWLPQDILSHAGDDTAAARHR
ncbi:MAG: hypothetical protein ACRD29_07085 [Acidimicrobiales bacterium]